MTITEPHDLKLPRVLIVEDDAPLRSGVESTLQAEGFEVRAEPDGREIQGVAECFRPDLAILDVRLETGPDGYAIARLLRAASDLPVIFLTAADSVESRLWGFEAGADDYVVKPVSMPELMARVRALLRRSGRLVSEVWQAGDLLVDESTRKVVRGEHPVDLTRTEYELMLVLVRNFGRAVSKLQLLSEVWGYEGYDKNVVEVHMSSLRRKLEAFGPRVVHTVHGNFYQLQA